MTVFSEAEEKEIPVVVSYHAAVRWIERVGADIPIEDAKAAIANGLQTNGKLLLNKGDTRYIEWLGLVYPLIKRTYSGELSWIVKTALLKGKFE